MESDDIMQCTHKTADFIKNSMKKPELIIGFNCILRYLRMQDENVQKDVYSIINGVAPYCGFTTLGEQIDKTQVNLTNNVDGIIEMNSNLKNIKDDM